MNVTMLDDNGVEIKEGVLVEPASPGWEGAPEGPGRVVKVTELDGDVDDEGRSYAIPPEVHVLWPNALSVDDTDRYTGFCFDGWDEDSPFVVEDLAVVTTSDKEER